MDVTAALELLDRDGPSAFPVGDLCTKDLPGIAWSGSPLHVESVGAALLRVPLGEVDYLAVRTPTGEIVAKGGLNHTDAKGPGMLWQLAVHDELRSRGLGTRLICALEDRARARGIESCWLGVEVDNTAARRLYERLGYAAFAEEASGWETEDADGRRSWYQAQLVLMRRAL